MAAVTPKVVVLVGAAVNHLCTIHPVAKQTSSCPGGCFSSSSETKS